jgi:3'-phosphoadenosine 5'-phosphosulfate sulfotransferase (PAPS reductase)/FAD synthetase
MSKATVLNYGGGRQTVAICLLIARGVLAKPDRIVMADTGREKPTTFEYLEKYTRPLMREHGLEIEIAEHSLAKVDLYSHKGSLLLPVFTQTGKLPAFCSAEWKRDVVERYLRKQGITGGVNWLGLAFDEKRRWERLVDSVRHHHRIECPLVDLMMTTADCLALVRKHGWPLPRVSSCWMCPHQRNEEWAHTKEHRPDLFAEACKIDEEVRADDEQGGVFLHHSRVPLSEADLTVEEKPDVVRQCSLGTCFV